jgi:hypothetical protein
MGFAGPGLRLLSPPAREPHCTPVGGYARKRARKRSQKASHLLSRGGDVRVALGTSPRQPSRASRSPGSYVAAIARGPTGNRSSKRSPASTTPAPPPPPSAPRAGGPARHLGRLLRRKGIPRVRRGLGSVGAWPLARPTSKPPGVPTGWGSPSG